MIHARFSFGYIGAGILSTVNIVVFMGFLILNVILGGQALASASGGDLSWDAGIAIIAIISLLVRLCTFEPVGTCRLSFSIRLPLVDTKFVHYATSRALH